MLLHFDDTVERRRRRQLFVVAVAAAVAEVIPAVVVEYTRVQHRVRTVAFVVPAAAVAAVFEWVPQQQQSPMQIRVRIAAAVTNVQWAWSVADVAVVGVKIGNLRPGPRRQPGLHFDVA